ncbi:Apolipoprotein N-acyltransferase [invertebrate metagenome]|uniref:Apolipoprotein N-acyltransferase n=1 Tax=invertebrate metagenome TaxID=1711999 RepID=A0A2H9T6K6_9ZZZZ
MKKTIKKYGKVSVASLLSGSIASLAFSPFDVWLAMIISLGMAFYLVQSVSPRRALLSGWLYGIGLFGAGASWIYVSIHQFGAASVPLAGFLTALFVAAISVLFVVPPFWLYAKLTSRGFCRDLWQRALLFSVLWVLFEWCRSWLLTGFPWLISGYTLLDTVFQSWAPVTGVYGLSFAIVLTSSLLGALAISLLTEGRHLGKVWLFLCSLVAVWGCLSAPLASVEWTKEEGELTFSAVQGNIAQSLKWNPSYVQDTLSTYLALTEAQWQSDLVIWPENAIPVLSNDARSFLEQLSQKAGMTSTALITGIPLSSNGNTRSVKYFNGILALGHGEGHYAKQKLVPFGEYVPFDSVLRGLIAFFDLPMSSFSKGSRDQNPLTINGIPIATYICYEVIYPDFAASLARGTGFLVTVSNDTWFGHSIGPMQHFQMARMRALETGRFLIRATNDGVTALVNDKGVVVQQIPRFEAGVLSGTITVKKGNTPFMQLGSWPVVGLCLLLSGLILTGRKIRK